MTVYTLPTFSTCASTVSYDDQKQVLTVTYRGSGKSYQYSEVPLWRFKDLMNAPSVGRYINEWIKPVYPVK